ncbi:MAG TPA: aldose 1-epimerase [Symbiobacteriaceae bacterium]|nr:aldose 1-epimerase [Symbiobacteriaceae bacterium]
MEQQYEVRRTQWQDEPIIELVDQQAGLTARLAPRLGGNLFSLFSAPHQHELLWAPESPKALVERPTRFGVPLLMPPGRMKQGQFTYGGHTYQFDRNRGEHHSHGLVLTTPWEVEAEEAGPAGAAVTIGVRSWQHVDLLRQFPHAFHLRVEYRLVEGMLRCTASVRNESDRSMPFGMGFHTYLSAPGDPMAWTVRLGASRRFALEDGFPTGAVLPVSGAFDLRQGRPVGESPLDDVYTDLERDAEGWSGVELASAERGLRVYCEADERFPIWVLFTGRVGEGFLAPEPYTIAPNGFNLPQAVSRMWEIAPGAEVPVGTWRIRLA